MATYTDIGREFFPPIGEPQRVKDLWGNVIAPQDPNRTYIGPNVDWGTLAKALIGTIGLVSQPDLTMPLQIKAFHGSPYKFGKFINQAIGTGEGAQAFGYGHYLTESPEIAEAYAQRLGRPKGINPSDLAGRVMEVAKDKTLAIKELYGRKGVDPTFNSRIDEAVKHIRNDTYTRPIVYETTIHKGKQPNEYTFLEWDKPVSPDIVKKIRQRLEELGEFQPIMFATGEGRSFFNDLKAILGQEKTSKILNEIGVSGIKYPTGSLSGMKGTGKYNYVVFNPEDITIEGIK